MKSTKLERLTVVLYGIVSMFFIGVDLFMDVPYSSSIVMIHGFIFMILLYSNLDILNVATKEDVEK